VPFIPFIKCDTEEADKLAGKYLSRGQHVAHLCRYCCCPTQKSDQPRASYPRKTVPMITKLVKDKDMDGLRNMSQQCITNAMYQLRFGAHNEEGVHGACPLEMLHALLLGMFKYIRDCFFDQVGSKSRAAKEVNALAIEIGVLFCRQSDRAMPKTQFSQGIKKGKLMAKEYTGVLLIIAAILRSTEGKNLLCGPKAGRKSGKFAQDPGLIDDWIMLVETMLMWEEWLKSDEMAKEHVEAAKKKHLYIMYLMRKVGNRTKGMGLKITKFHAIMHMAQDIIHFGVPMNYDTGSDESGHKASKTAAKVTQKRKDLFDEQVGQRLIEVQTLDLAQEEIVNDLPLWGYFDQEKNRPAHYAHTLAQETRVGGVKFQGTVDEAGEYKLVAVRQTKGSDGIQVEVAFTEFIEKLTRQVSEYLPSLHVATYYRRDGVTYRGSAHYSGGVWRDWVMVDWGEDDGKLPNKIWGFVDLRKLPKDNDLNCGGQSPIAPAIYGIVESADIVHEKRGVRRSELFVPLLKRVGKMAQERVVDLEFWLADVGAFDEPIAVIPDIGGPANAYFMLRRRRQWREDFMEWLMERHETYPDFEEDAEDIDETYEESEKEEEDSEEEEDDDDDDE